MSRPRLKVLLSTAYLPPVHWFAALLAGWEVMLESHETYARQTYRNRCEIATANGKLSLTIPVIKIQGNHTPTTRVIISYQTRWTAVHWGAITSAYTHSPFFLYYRDDLELFYHQPYHNLFTFNLELIQTILRWLKMNISLQLTDRFEKNPSEGIDLRFLISPKRPFPYINFPHYHQVFAERHGFIPGLSIIDLIFNEGPGAVQILQCMAHDLKAVFESNPPAA